MQVNPTKDCLGERKNDGPYEFEDYATVGFKVFFRAFRMNKCSLHFALNIEIFYNTNYFKYKLFSAIIINP